MNAPPIPQVVYIHPDDPTLVCFRYGTTQEAAECLKFMETIAQTKQ